MAYFSNGSEGTAYQAAYCNRCYHDKNEDCPIWDIHLKYNYDNLNQPILDTLIPRLDNGLPGECKMFIPIDKVAE